MTVTVRKSVEKEKVTWDNPISQFIADLLSSFSDNSSTIVETTPNNNPKYVKYCNDSWNKPQKTSFWNW